MKINIFKTQHELISSIALFFIKTANKAIEEQGAFNVVLSGGNSPIKLYKLLSTNEYKHQVNWSKVNFFFGDERYVHVNDSQSNFLMVKKALFEPLKISKAKIFEIDTRLISDEAAKKYNETIVSHFNQMPVRFDLVLLGLGDNGHTASLFPSNSVLNETAATVRAVFLKEQNSYRITMTAPMINRAKHIAFLVYGKEKAIAVHHVLQGELDMEKYPAQLIRPVAGDLQWFLDEAASSLLENQFINFKSKSL